MKKTIFSLLIFLIAGNVSASDVYYSDYSFVSEENKCPAETETLKTESEKRYKWYKNEITEGGYYTKGENPNKYPLIDETDFYETEYSTWQDDNPTPFIGRAIESRTIFTSKKMKPIRYIGIENMYSALGRLEVNEVEIYAGNNKLNYNFSGYKYSNEFEEVINDGLYGSDSYISSMGFIKLDLNNYYPVDSIKIIIHTSEEVAQTKFFNIKLYGDINEKEYIKYYFESSIVDSKLIFETRDFELVNPMYESEIVSYNYIEPTISISVVKDYEYRYKDIFYKYYSEKKTYSDYYSVTSIDDYNFRDDTDYIYICKTFKREKVIFKDIEIKKDSYDLNDYISYDGKYEINSNINILENEIYKVIYELPFGTFEREALVNIKEKDTNSKKVEPVVAQISEEEEVLFEKEVLIDEYIKDEIISEGDIIYEEPETNSNMVLGGVTITGAALALIYSVLFR